MCPIMCLILVICRALSPLLYERVANFVQIGYNEDRWKCVQIIVPRRADVPPLVESLEGLFPDHRIIGMVSGEMTAEEALAWQDPSVMSFAVTTTIGTLGINNLQCDAVIHLLAYFGIQSYLQGANRAGRLGGTQRALSIFLHCPNRWEFAQSLDENEDFRVLAFQASGFSIDIPEIANHVSVKSMEQFLNAKKCRYTLLCQAMDNLTPPESCLGCDNCLRELELPDEIRRTWDRAVELVPAGTEQQVQHNQVEPEQHDEVRRRLQLEQQDLDEWFHNLSGAQCMWHPQTILGHIQNDDLFVKTEPGRPGTMICCYSLRRLLGHENERGLICPRCGDNYDRNGAAGCAGPLTCEYQSPYRLRLTGCVSCNYCCYARKCHRNGEVCPKDKAWYLVVWALRSDDGYALVKAEFNLRQGEAITPGLQFPEQIFFKEKLNAQSHARSMDENKEKWTNAMDWLVSHETTNLRFWRAVRAALEKQRSESRSLII